MNNRAIILLYRVPKFPLSVTAINKIQLSYNQGGA